MTPVPIPPSDDRAEPPALPPGWWEAALAATSDAISTVTLSGIVTSWNPGARQLFGYANDEVVGRHLNLLEPERRHSEMDDVLQRVAEGKPVASFDTTRIRKGGEEVDVSISITPVLAEGERVEGAVIIARDISDRKRFEQLLSQEIRARETFEGRLVDLNRQLRQRLQDLETLLEVLPVGIGIAHDQACSEIRLNPALADILRMSSGVVPAERGFPDDDMPFQLMQDGEVLAAGAFPLHAAASTGQPVSDVEIDIVHDDGTTAHLLCFAAPLFDDNEDPRGAVGAFIDVTEKRRAESELRMANTIKDEFLGLVSHELRTPLTIVLGLARFLSREGSTVDAETLRDTHIQLRSDAERLSNVIENMLILSRLDFEATELEPVRVSTIVERAVQHHRARFPYRIVETDVGSSGLAEGNATWVEQVVANLLTNAEKYSPSDAAISVSVRTDAEAIEIVVGDRGQGIAPEDAAMLFEPFYRSQQAKGDMTPGLGLGLTVCKRLTELQNGSVHVRERDAGGSEFIVRIPVLGSSEDA